MIGQAAEALHVLGKSTQALDAARDQVVFEWLEPAERKAALEADSDFVGSIRAATMEHVAGVDQRATAAHDGLGDFFGLCLYRSILCCTNRRLRNGASCRGPTHRSRRREESPSRWHRRLDRRRRRSPRRRIQLQRSKVSAPWLPRRRDRRYSRVETIPQMRRDERTGLIGLRKKMVSRSCDEIIAGVQEPERQESQDPRQQPPEAAQLMTELE